MRIFGRFLAFVVFFLLLGAAFLNFAEFNASNLRPRIAAAFLKWIRP